MHPRHVKGFVFTLYVFIWTMLGCARQVIDPSLLVNSPSYTPVTPLEEVLKYRKEISTLTITPTQTKLETQHTFSLKQIIVTHIPPKGYEATVVDNDTLYSFRPVGINVWFADKLYKQKMVDSSVIDISGNYSNVFDEAKPDIKVYLFNLVLAIHKRPRHVGVYEFSSSRLKRP